MSIRPQPPRRRRRRSWVAGWAVTSLVATTTSLAWADSLAEQRPPDAAAPASPPLSAAAPANAAASALGLAQAIALALQNSPTPRIARARVTLAQAGLAAARAPAAPTLSSTSSLGGALYRGVINQVQLLGDGQTARYAWVDVGLEARWLLIDFGRTRHRTDGARLELSSAELEARAALLTAARDAALAYYTLAFDQALYAASEDTLAQRERQLATTRALVESGVRSPGDQTRASVALEAAWLDRAVADARVQESAVALTQALGLEPSAALRVAAPRELSVEDTPARAARQAVRADAALAALEQRVRAARARLNAAQAERRPTLEANASGALRYLRGPELRVATVSQDLGVGLTFGVPLLDAARSAAVDVAAGEAAQLDAELFERTSAVRSAATRAALQVGSKRVVLERAERVADGARANLSDVEARYEQGFVGPLEMLDAQNVEAEARVAVIEARRELELAKVRLLHCTAEMLESVPELARPGARPRS